MRVGLGYDAHRLVTDRKLVLGGVEIPYEKGLLGHSDADVLTHALCDALLGAAGEGDIGMHFPDNDPEYKGISSIILLKKTVGLLHEKNFFIVNCDVTVCAEAPKLGPYRDAIKKTLAFAMGISENRVNIKATTTEKMGFTGKGEGIAAMCVALIDECPLA